MKRGLMLPVVIEKGKFKLYDIRKLVLVKWNYCHIDVKSDMGYKKQSESFRSKSSILADYFVAVF